MNASRLCLLGALGGLEHLATACRRRCPPANSSGGAAPATSNKEQIVGTWELVKSDQGWPAGTTWEFAKDGKAVVDLGGGAKAHGAYEVNGDALKWTPEGKDANALTIKTLTDDKLVVADDKGKTNEFKKKGGDTALADPGSLQKDYAGKFGTKLALNVTGSAAGPVWGKGPYTLDSTLAAAAVHAGVLKVGETGVVQVEVVKPPPSFAGSNQNGVKSEAWDAFPDGAFQFIKPGK